MELIKIFVFKGKRLVWVESMPPIKFLTTKLKGASPSKNMGHDC